MGGIGGEVHEFVRITLEVVEKFVGGGLVEITGVNVALTAHALPGERRGEVEVLAEKMPAPLCRRAALDERGEAAAFVGGRWLHAGPVEERRGQIDIERQLSEDPTALGFRQARVVDDERDAQRFLEVRPLTLKATVAEVVPVIGAVDDNGVVGEAGAF